MTISLPPSSNHKEKRQLKRIIENDFKNWKMRGTLSSEDSQGDFFLVKESCVACMEASLVNAYIYCATGISTRRYTVLVFERF